MDIFGIGLPELVVILLLILIVVGPTRLPEMAAQLGRFIRAARKLSSQVTSEFNTTMSELEQEYDEMKGEWKEVSKGLDETTRAVTDELQAADKDVRKALGEAKSAGEGPAKKAAAEGPTKPGSSPS